MRKTSFILLTLLAAFASANVARADSSVPASAKTQAVRVHVTRGGADHVVRALVAPTLHEYYLFPVFELARAEMSFSSSGPDSYGAPQPLLDLHGAVDMTGHGYDDYARIVVGVDDVLEGDGGQPLLDALKNTDEPAVKGKDRLTPDLLEGWTATLEIRDPADSGRYLPIGKPWQFSRDGSANLKMSFVLARNEEARAWHLLDRASSDDLRLTISGSYNAKFTTTDFRVAGEFLDDQVKDLVNKVTSTAPDGKQAVLFVAIGGDVDHEFGFTSMFRRTLQVSIEQRDDADASKKPDWDLVNTFIGRTLGEFEDKVKLSDLESSTVVTFLLSSGARVTTPIGELKKVTDYFKTERDKKIHDLFEKSSQEHTKVDVTTEASVDVIDLIKGSAKLGVDYDHMTADQQKEEHDRFTHDLDELNKVVDGSFPAVAAMKLSELERISTGGYFKASLESSRFTEGVKELPLRINFDGPALRRVQVSEAFIRGFRARIEAARVSFREYQRSTLDGASYESFSDSTALSVFMNGGATETADAVDNLRVASERVRAALPATWHAWEVGSGTERKVYAREGDAGPYVEVSLLYVAPTYEVVIDFESA